MSRPSFVVDPADPRAPDQEIWDAMTEDERRIVLADLPSEYPRATPPEGDLHRIPKAKAMEALDEFFRSTGRRVYLSSELPVYYPGERMFAPDLIAVLDVETHPRDKWVVSIEDKGIDLALEVTLRGDRAKDLEDNVQRYARVGIPEYFVYDAVRRRIVGHRLDEASSRYAPVVPQGGRWPSRVLGLDLSVEEGRVRFFHGSAPLLEANELIGRLTRMVDELVQREEQGQLQLEAERVKAETERVKAETERARADRLAARLRELGEELD